MKPTLNASKIVILLAIVAISIGFSAFRQPGSSRQKYFRDGYSRGDEDTSTRRKRNRSENAYNSNQLDEQMKMLDKQLAELDVQLEKIDFSKIEKEINTQLKKVNVENINKHVEEALAKLDFKELELKITDVRIPKVEMDKLKKEMEQLKMDFKNEKFDINIDREKINKEIQEDLKKAKEEMKMAQGEMVKARATMYETKELINKLSADGLIDFKNPYSIEIKEGELFINGTKQSKEVNEKYKSYLKDKNFSIKNEGGNKEEI